MLCSVHNAAEFRHEGSHHFGIANRSCLPRVDEFTESGDIDRTKPLIKIDQVKKPIEASVVAKMRRAGMAGDQAIGLEIMLLKNFRKGNRTVMDTFIIAAKIERQGRSKHAGKGEARHAAVGEVIRAVNTTCGERVEIWRNCGPITGNTKPVIAQGVDDEQNYIGHEACNNMQNLGFNALPDRSEQIR